MNWWGKQPKLPASGVKLSSELAASFCGEPNKCLPAKSTEVTFEHLDEKSGRGKFRLELFLGRVLESDFEAEFCPGDGRPCG